MLLVEKKQLEPVSDPVTDLNPAVNIDVVPKMFVAILGGPILKLTLLAMKTGLDLEEGRADRAS